MGADYLAVSFPICADDIHLARELFVAAGGHAVLLPRLNGRKPWTV